jgi:N-acetylneuraminate synthase/sialic acid synthase
VGSPDLTNLPLIKDLAALGMPLVISTGMSTLTEVAEAVAVASQGHRNLLLLHCISAYPAALEDSHLRLIPRLGRLFELPVGYSGHELGSLPSLAAVALGACAIERHLTLSRRMRGSDHAISLEPDEFRQLVSDVRGIETALGSEERRVFPAEEAFREKLSKGIVASRELPAGHVLTSSDLTLKSPAKGLSGLMLEKVVGRAIRRKLGQDEPVLLDDLTEA